MMNERIKQLAEQAGCKVMDGEWYIPSATGLEKIVYTKGIGLEKFAELIVKECLEACSRANEIRHLVPPTQQQVVLSCMDEIETHFGVEE